MTNRITPYMNFLTLGTNTDYKTGGSTIGIFSLIQNRIQNEQTAQLKFIIN